MRLGKILLIHFVGAFLTIAIPQALVAGVRAAYIILLVILTLELGIGACLVRIPSLSKIAVTVWNIVLIMAAVLSIGEAYLLMRLGLELNAQTVQYGMQLLPALGPLVLGNGWWLIPILLGLVALFILTMIARRLEIKLKEDQMLFKGAGTSALILASMSGILISYTDTVVLRWPTTSSAGGVARGAQVQTITFPEKVMPGKEEQKSNIVLLLLETVKANATTPYNTELKTTPFLQSLAQEGWVAERAYVPLPHSYKSLVSVFCGIPPHPNIANKIETTPNGIPAPCLPELLKPHGYTSAYFQTTSQKHDNRQQQITTMGFDHLVASEHLDREKWELISVGWEDKSMTAPILEWVDKQEGPFLVSAITMASHFPYKTPKDFPTQQYSKNERWNKYLNAIRYSDSFLEDIYRAFEERDLLDNTIFVVVGDHGEDFGNHIPEGHHQNVYNDSIQVPLVVWSRDLPQAPQRITGARSHVDIVPTIIDLLGMKPLPRPFYGRSLLESADNRTVYSMCTFKLCTAITGDRYKYISNGSAPAEHYDVLADPDEEKNLEIGHASKETMETLIQDWRWALDQLYGVD